MRRWGGTAAQQDVHWVFCFRCSLQTPPAFSTACRYDIHKHPPQFFFSKPSRALKDCQKAAVCRELRHISSCVHMDTVTFKLKSKCSFVSVALDRSRVQPDVLSFFFVLTRSFVHVNGCGFFVATSCTSVGVSRPLLITWGECPWFPSALLLSWIKTTACVARWTRKYSAALVEHARPVVTVRAAEEHQCHQVS